MIAEKTAKTLGVHFFAAPCSSSSPYIKCCFIANPRRTI